MRGADDRERHRARHKGTGSRWVAVSVVDFGWSRGSDKAAAMPLTSLQ
jgi:hypothetical protein